MTRFVELHRGYYVNLQQLKSIQCKYSPDKRRETIYTLLEERKPIGGHNIIPDHMNATVIPAQPGFLALYVWSEAGGEPKVGQLPIIAWAIDVTAEWYAVTPVTTRGIDTSTYLAVLQPDGLVVEPEEVYDNLEVWREQAFADFRKRHPKTVE
jgi:hypothetical protein